MTQTLKTLIPLTIVFALLVTTNFIYAAWSAPGGAPSAGNNALAPINVGSTDQVKTAGLFLDSLAVTGNALIQSAVHSPSYCDENGANCFSSASSTPSGSGETVFTNWPDAITCNIGSDSFVLNIYSQSPTQTSYKDHYDYGGRDKNLVFNTVGKTYLSNNNLASSDCVNKTITQLYTGRQAFNFAGGSGASAASAGYVDSPEYRYPVNRQTISFAHGLGHTPSNQVIVIKATVANHGYVVGDEIIAPAYHTHSGHGGLYMFSNDTVVEVTRTGYPPYWSRDTKTHFYPNPSQWNIIMRVWE